MVLGSKTRVNFEYLVGLLLTFLVIITFLSLSSTSNSSEGKATSISDHQLDNTTSASSDDDRCDFFSGRWVYDDKSQPQYRYEQCTFLLEEYACEKYGRKDLKFQNWRWQPHHCDLPRFNGTAFLEKIRGKKLHFVGDSLNRNQWNSMICLIESSIPSSSSKSVTRDGDYVFQATEYNATIVFHWSPYLVESNRDDPVLHPNSGNVVRIKNIEGHARRWTDADILVFDSYVWWVNPETTLLWGSFSSSDAIYQTLDTNPRLYELALNTWSEWLEFHINRTKTKLFFMSLSPTHKWAEDWSTEQNCYNQSEPILNESYWGIATDTEIMHVAESAIRNLEKRGVKVTYLNITQLSDYRKDGHPSIYKKFFHPLSEEQLGNPKSYSDCVHWCLPGVPDTWNQILYSYIMNS